MDGPLPEIIEVGGSLPQNMVNDFFNCQCNKLCVFRQTMCGQTLYLRNKSVLLPWPSYLQDVQTIFLLDFSGVSSIVKLLSRVFVILRLLVTRLKIGRYFIYYS